MFSLRNRQTTRPARQRLSVRLLALFLATGVALVAVIAGTFRTVWQGQYQNAFQPHLNLYAEYIQRDIGVPPDLEAAAQLADDLQLDIHISGPGLDWSSSGAPITTADIRIFRRHASQDTGLEFGEYAQRRFIVRMTAGAYQIAFLTGEHRHAHRGGWKMLWLIALVLLVLLACYRALRWMLQPIATLEAGVKQIGAGELNHRIAISRRDELGSLARSINAMADELQQMLEAKRQLLLAISHELRSPLTRMRVSTALLDDHPQALTLRRDIAQMEQLISELLEAERLNSRHSGLQTEPVNPAELIRSLIDEEFRDAPLRLELPPDPTLVELDPVRIRLLLRNLLSNALRHNVDRRGPVVLRLAQTRAGTRLEVLDCGEGMSAEQLRQATQPMWRSDESRQRATGGFGLGLYLCLKIAEAHGGKLELQSTPGLGTSVAVVLPPASGPECQYSDA